MALPPDIIKQQEQIETAYRARSVDDPDCFIRGLSIPLVGQFEDCMADFQRKCFNNLVPSMRAVQLGRMPPIRRFWIERTKKASKDADIAAVLAWFLAFPKRPLLMQIGAANQDQAGIIKRRLSDLLFYNPWLQDHIELQGDVCLHKGQGPNVRLEILCANIAGSHGATPDVMVVNELSHITKWEFAENLLDNADGVPNGIVIVATNAGYVGSKAETWRKNAMGHWCCHVLSEPAPWHSEATLADAKRRNPGSRFARLWKGKWVSGKGDALAEEEIDVVFSYKIGPTLKPEPGWQYIAGLDLGISEDHSGLVIVGINREKRIIRVSYFRAWEPGAAGKVNLMDVSEAVYAAYRTYGLRWVGYDPHQCQLMAQQLAAKGVPMQEVTFTPNNLKEMATAMVETIQSRVLQSYDDEGGTMRRDLGKMSIVEKSYGLRLEASKDEYGHADVGTALAILLPKAVEMLGGYGGLQKDDVIAFHESAELTKEEVEEMPEELRDIYESDPLADLYDETPVRRGGRRRVPMGSSSIAESFRAIQATADL